MSQLTPHDHTMEQDEEDLTALMLRNRTAYKKLLHMDTTNEEAATTAGTAGYGDVILSLHYGGG